MSKRKVSSPPPPPPPPPPSFPGDAAKCAAIEPKRIHATKTRAPKTKPRQASRTSRLRSAESQHPAVRSMRKRSGRPNPLNIAQRHGRYGLTTRITLPPHPPRVSQPLPALPPSVLTSGVIATNNPETAASKAATAPTTGTPQGSAVAEAAAATRLKALHATATLLQTLHVRNRNQHRGQGWWKWFSMLRRKVVDVLRVEVQLWGLRFGGAGAGFETVDGTGGSHMEALTKRQRNKETKKQQEQQQGVEQTKAEEHGLLGPAEMMRRRLALEEKLGEQKVADERWLKEVVVPRAWVAFMALVGDGQFAGLGVVLLGVLGDVAGLVRGCEDLEGGTGKMRRRDEQVDAVVRDEEPRTSGREKDVRTTQLLKHDDSTMEDVGEPVQRRKKIGTTALARSLGDAIHDGSHRTGPENDDIAIQAVSAALSRNEPLSSPLSEFEDLVSDHRDAPIQEDESKPSPPSRPDGEEKKSNAKTKTKETNLALSTKSATSAYPDPEIRRQQGETSAAGRELSVEREKKKQTTRTIEEVRESEQPDSTDMDVQKIEGKVRGKPDVKGKSDEATTKTDKMKEKKMQTKKKTTKKPNKGRNAIDDLFAGFV